MGSLVFCQVSALFVTFCPREHNVVLYRMVSSIPMQCREIVLSVDVRAYFSQHTLWSLFVITGCVPFCNMMYDILLKGFKVKAFILKISLSGASHYNYFLHSTWSMPLKITSMKKQLYTGGYIYGNAWRRALHLGHGMATVLLVCILTIGDLWMDTWLFLPNLSFCM